MSERVTMKALVLSGGLGTRLRPFTHSMAKQLVPVANKPVLRHCLDNIRDIGIVDVGVVVGARADEIAADFLRDDDFVLYLGDNILADGVADAARVFRARRPDAQLIVAKVSDPRQYGVAVVDRDGRVLDLREKPAEPLSDLAVVGVYFFTAAVHDAVRAIRPSARGELEITDALTHMVRLDRTVTAAEYGGYWRDTGSVADLLDCNRALLERITPAVRGKIDAASTVRGAVVVEPDAVVTRSRLVGPLIVGERAVITDSDLGPSTSVGPDCVVTGSRVTESMLLEGAHVTGVPELRESVVGRWAHVGGSGAGAGATVVIGDHARAEVAA